MNKKGCLAFSVLAFSMLLASCGPSDKPDDNKPDTTPKPEEQIKDVVIPDGFGEKDMPNEVKVFNTTYGTDPTTLAAYATNHQPNSQQFANFIDGMVENDKFGRLVPSLAKAIPTPVTDPDTGESTYTFELKDNLQWTKWEGGKLVPAGKVTANDFVLAAKLACDNLNAAGGTSYLYHMFIKGSAKYTKYTQTEGLTQKEKDEFWDANVGIKADGDNKVVYTLPKPMDYFPTVLTYGCYYPVPTDLYNKITTKYGSVDGNNTKDNIWYCGAFALSELEPGNHIDFVKNPNYWDKDSVHLDKVHQMAAPQDADLSWGRKQFEAGSTDAFTVREVDQAGWDQYVTGGANGAGSPGNPVGEFANAINATPEGSTFYLGYNFHRTQMKNTELPEAKVRDFEKAIANANFRKAILYATNKGTFNARMNPSNPTWWNTNTYTVPTLAVDDDGKDYVDYIADEFATQNNITSEEAKNIIGSGKPGVYNPAAAKQYLEIAKAELGDSVTYPIQFEMVEQANESQSGFYKAFNDMLQNNLDPDADIVKVTTKQLTQTAMDDAFFNLDYSVASYFGWGPDYGDPLSFLNTVTKGGDLTPNFGFASDPVLEDKVLGTYTNLVKYADSLTDKSERLKAYAKAEYYLLFDQAVLIPMMERFQGISVTVTKIRPKTGQLAPYGTARDKLKGTVVYDEKLSKVQFAYVVDKYNKEKAALGGK